MWKISAFFAIAAVVLPHCCVIAEAPAYAGEETYTIEGKALAPSFPPPGPGGAGGGGGGGGAALQLPLPFSMEATEVVVNGRKRVGFVRPDGSFSVPGLPAGSHLVEISNPNYFFEPVKVDISTKGKFRARKANLVQPSQVVQVPYPLKMKALAPFRYFQIREQWRITDFIWSPMVLMMILPLLLVMVLPKLMSDPETRKEMEQLQMPKYDMPELSEMMTSWFSGDTKSKQAKPAVKQAPANRRRQQ